MNAEKIPRIGKVARVVVIGVDDPLAVFAVERHGSGIVLLAAAFVFAIPRVVIIGRFPRIRLIARLGRAQSLDHRYGFQYGMPSFGTRDDRVPDGCLSAHRDAVPGPAIELDAFFDGRPIATGQVLRR